MLKRKDTIGMMGNTGQSTANHLHIDCVEGYVSEIYHQYQIYNKQLTPSPEQLLFFIDEELFGIEPIITTGYADVDYFHKRKKVHYGYDVVPTDRFKTKEHFGIIWNRSKEGILLSSGYNDDYGYYMNIGFRS